LQEGPLGFRLGMDALFDQQAMSFCHIMPDDHSTRHALLCTLHRLLALGQ
jgi:hypothetical protein